ncbi:MAG TPA: MBL fold metallo-hydrolase [Oligoflexia bacterium]|nr:MBL fold metallo-hydrolase [Oligoflexia bacterium]HMP49722.1 MBL fold metallo-hydrolase [Oligoflexia bacterium]
MNNKIFYSIILLLLFITSDCRSENDIHISFLNTNDGDAIFLEHDDIRFLIDTGPPLLQKTILDKVKKGSLSIIITHPHPDHYGGLFYLQGLAEIKTIYDNGESLLKMHEGQDYAAWYGYIIRQNPSYKSLKKGDVPYSTPNLKIEVLWPPFISDKRDFNENSLVLLITAFKRRILLMGDAPNTVESIITNEEVAPESVDVLKIGHHASEDVASEPFLKRTSPRFSVITGSGNQRYKYNHPETLKRLKKYSDRVLSTNDLGSITYTITPSGADNFSVK